MNILITISDSYVPYAAVTLQSLVDSNPTTPFDIYIICPDITENNKQTLRKQFSSRGGVVIWYIDIYDQVKMEIEDLSQKLPMHISFILRLYAAHLLPNTIRQILYIDVDTIISSSLDELSSIYLDDNTALAAIKDLVRYDDYTRLGIDITKHAYFNSGVCLLNLDYWRCYDVGRKCLSILAADPTLYKFPDQDVLNVVCQGHVQYLHPRYNCLVFFFARQELVKARVSEDELDLVLEAVKYPAIIHYVFLNKPWFKGDYLPRRDLWLSYLEKTPYKDIHIGYRNGWKGRLRYIAKRFMNTVPPFIGLQTDSNIFLPRRQYKHIRFLSLLLYYGFAYYLPNFDAKYGGGIGNAIRLWCIKNLFDFVGYGVKIGRKARFGTGKGIRIGSRSNIGAYCQLPSDIIIGNDVMMGPNNFFFGNFTHEISDTTRPMIEQGFKHLKGRTEIGDDVWIGRECIFMPCRHIGSHSVIGARSVVTKDVGSYVIVAGNPAKIVKERK